ncbi:adenosine deaminase-like protein [Leishmania guyanensis]|uniref:tRNA-specific adenosine deaminase 1 n=2 Tax=Leishmania guyanensis species complex TaxID=38579 RepID=A0A1E1J4H4_LEIGU|nr:Putative adenosine deaminase-like protein [Leishmania guyanensis]
MEGNGASTSTERAGRFMRIAPRLWSDTPHGAVHRAVEAQPQPVWRQLWQRALANGALRPGSSCVVADTSEQEVSAQGKEGAIIVAAFVLSIPFIECPCAGKEEAVESSADVSMRRYVCVSLGSGSRSLAAQDAPASDDGEKVRRLFELRDGHAEVMARRGFVAFLLEMADASARCTGGAYADLFLRRCGGDGDVATVAGVSSCPKWELRETVAVHLVCTRWMCGSLAAVAGGSGRSGHLLLQAACGCWVDSTVQVEALAKEGERASSTVTHVGRHVLATHYSSLNGATQLLHAARVKPGKGLANLSMSCTDKVWRWCVLGVQGRRRASLFPVPMRLASIHILHTSFSDLGGLQTAVNNAAATFQWRNRRWWSHGEREVALPQAPKFSFFSGAEFAATRPMTATKSHDVDVSNDSGYSRSRWLCVSSLVGDRKRSRDEEAEASAFGSVTCNWPYPFTAGDHSCSLVLNTKAGLPQGMTGRALVRRCSTLSEIPWQQCPLSRPWMNHRVQLLLGLGKETALVCPSMATNAASASYAPASIYERSSPTITDDTDLSMSQRVHRYHLQRSGTDGDSIRLLWASSQINFDHLLEAAEGCKGTP